VRRRISTRERVDIFNRNNGICHLCSMKIDAGQEWDVSHDTPLEMGGDDAGDNLKPAHRRCHRHHTATVDVPIIRKAQRKEAKHIGARKSARPLPAGRSSPWKKTLSGKVVPRVR
jgi:5-methylcytosine-specific restriction protein A